MLDAIGELGYELGIHLDKELQVVFLNTMQDSSLYLFQIGGSILHWPPRRRS
jgi:hypothetical protein